MVKKGRGQWEVGGRVEEDHREPKFEQGSNVHENVISNFITFYANWKQKKSDTFKRWLGEESPAPHQGWKNVHLSVSLTLSLSSRWRDMFNHFPSVPLVLECLPSYYYYIRTPTRKQRPRFWTPLPLDDLSAKWPFSLDKLASLWAFCHKSGEHTKTISLLLHRL